MMHSISVAVLKVPFTYLEKAMGVSEGGEPDLLDRPC